MSSLKGYDFFDFKKSDVKVNLVFEKNYNAQIRFQGFRESYSTL